MVASFPYSGLLLQWQGTDARSGLGPMLRLLIAEAQVDTAVAKALAEERRTRWHHLAAIMTKARSRGELNPALSNQRAEQRVISLLSPH